MLWYSFCLFLETRQPATCTPCRIKDKREEDWRVVLVLVHTQPGDYMETVESTPQYRRIRARGAVVQWYARTSRVRDWTLSMDLCYCLFSTCIALFCASVAHGNKSLNITYCKARLNLASPTSCNNTAGKQADGTSLVCHIVYLLLILFRLLLPAAAILFVWIKPARCQII